MTKLILHILTSQQIDQLVAAPAHALLLHGPSGTGKFSVANHVAARVLDLSPDKLVNYPYYYYIDAPAVSAEAIEEVRKLEHFLSLKVPLAGVINRVVVISDAHTLSTAAQNALLKTIEEPPQSTMLILTATQPTAVLPTISSRLQAIAVKKPAINDLKQHFIDNNHEASAVDQVAAVSGGLPGLMTALLTNDSHPLLDATNDARRLLQASLYERFLMADDLTKKRDHFLNVVYILQQMAHSRLQTTTGSQFIRWQLILSASYQAAEQLQASVQPKLVVDSLLLKLK